MQAYKDLTISAILCPTLWTYFSIQASITKTGAVLDAYPNGATGQLYYDCMYILTGGRQPYHSVTVNAAIACAQ